MVRVSSCCSSVLCRVRRSQCCSLSLLQPTCVAIEYHLDALKAVQACKE